jgi:5-methylcytosine-specific restriction enzyme A
MPTRPPVHGAHDRHAEYEQQRGNARQQGYTSRWDRVARAYRRANPLCVGCEAIGRVTLAQLVDHVIPHRGNVALMWEPSNLQSLCKWHHDVVKQRLEQQHAHGQINDDDLRMNSACAIALTKRHLR